MATTTVLHQYEEWLRERRERGEITESTYNTYLNDASRIFEVLLRHLPPGVIEGYMRAEGYRGYYGHVSNVLRVMARARKQIAFAMPEENQPRLPGV